MNGKGTAGQMLGIAVGTLLVGLVVDLAWHATHPEFETASDQLRAHAVIWIGTLLVTAAATLALLRGTHLRGYILVLVAGFSYAAVHIWHFLEHSRGRDSDLPHLLLLVTYVALLAGAAWVALARRQRRAA